MSPLPTPARGPPPLTPRVSCPGNVLQVPVHIPVNVCGNTVDIIGLLNPAFGNECEND